jgi:hypothetical protein
MSQDETDQHTRDPLLPYIKHDPGPTWHLKEKPTYLPTYLKDDPHGDPDGDPRSTIHEPKT